MLLRKTVTWLLFLAVPLQAALGLTGDGGSVSRAEQEEPAAKKAQENKKADQEYYELLRLFVDALDQVERNYVREVNRRELVEAAIEGMLSKLDQHTSYIAPQELDRFTSGVESEFSGLGIQVSLENGKLTILSPLVDTPAYRAGLMAGDVITHIGGQPTEGLSLDEAVRRLKGKIGTPVTLVVQHPGGKGTETVTLTREMIRVQTVSGAHRNPDDSWDFMCDKEHGIAYVRLAVFGRHTAEEMRRVLGQLVTQKMRGLVLDLRFNPGGLLTSAIAVADLFVSQGRIVSTAGRNVEEQTWEAEAQGTFEGFPMAVLVNRYSASASEIVAACLQDHQRAVIVGQRTFGKGTVQNVIPLEDGRSKLKMTTALYRRPNGKNIERLPDARDSDDWGVRPDEGLEVALSESQTQKLARAIRQRSLPRNGGPAAAAEELPPDPQLDKALAYLRARIQPQEKSVASEPAPAAGQR